MIESSNGVISSPALTDSFRRGHSQLRISLTEKCNLRCASLTNSNAIGLADHVESRHILHARTRRPSGTKGRDALDH